MGNRTNPNNANQYQLDARQKVCWDFYVDPRSETFGNGLASAKKAGYSESHANTITTESWFQEKVRRMNLLGKAEKVLDETLELPKQFDKEGMIDSGLQRVKLDAAKFVASTQGKNEGYATKTETDVTSGGEKLNTDVSPAYIAATAAGVRAFEEAAKKSLLE